MTDMFLLKLFRSNMLLLALLILVLLAYLLVNRPIGQLHSTQIALDAQIPLIPAFSVFYLLFLPALFGTIAYAYIAKTNFRPLALTIIIVYTLSYLVYIVHQTYVPRPPVPGHTIYADLLRWIYAHDEPYSGFPSTHASGATILAVYYFVASRRLGWLVIAFSLLVVLSTLFVRQHFILDATAGVLLGLTISLLIFRRTSARKAD